MAGHPTVQCRKMSDETYSMGLLGLLNGLFDGPDEHPHWGAFYRNVNVDDNGDEIELISFGVITNELIKSWKEQE